jgi:hypothetical protein
MTRRVAHAIAIALAFAASAAGPASTDVAGMYELVVPCGTVSPCPPAERRVWTLMLLHAPSREEPIPYRDGCARRNGYSFDGCFWRNSDHDSTLRAVGWSQKSSRIEVGLECGDEYGQQLSVKAGATSGTWKADFCCTQNAKGKDLMAHLKETVKFKRVGAADPKRCP